MAYTLTPKLYPFGGKMLSACVIARLTGVPVSTVRARLSAGQPVDQRRKPGTSPKLYEFRGMLLPIKEIAKLMGRSVDTAYNRIVGGKVAELTEESDAYQSWQDAPQSAVLITHNGETLCAAAWARRLGVPKETIYSRLRNGWTPARAVSEPLRPSYMMRSIRLRNLRVIQSISATIRAAKQAGGYSPISQDALGTGVGRHEIAFDGKTA